MADDNEERWNSFQKLRPSKGALKRHFRRIETSTLKHAHTFIIKRWSNVLEVRRHAISWLLLLVVLIAAVVVQSAQFARLYTTQLPESQTAYSEGIVGRLDTLNPIFAASLAERSASSLLFSGLLRYDDKGAPSADLARSWQFVDDGKRVVVKLRPNLTWQDGQPLTAKDVVYTVNMIKNVDVGSSLYSSWQGVSVKADNDVTLEFFLPFPYAGFVDSLTVGILPEHILGKVSPIELRNSAFNRAPIGSGPFSFVDIREIGGDKRHTLLSLASNRDYHLGATKLSRFYIHAFDSQSQLERSYETDEINAAVNLDIQTISKLPPSKQRNIIDEPVNDGTYAFLRTDSDMLKDVRVRQALQLATDKAAIIAKLGGHEQPLSGPLLVSQIGGVASDLPADPGVDLAKAQTLLDQAGWVKDKTGARVKDGKKLTLVLATSESGDFPAIASTISSQWSKLGVTVQTQLVNPDGIQQDVIGTRAYDVLLYEIVLGRDPDVYAYWHSSQATPTGLNLSNYHSGIVDDALDSARSRLEPELRTAKYRAFYKQWLADVPAVALFQPTLHYGENPNVDSVHSDQPLIDAVDRYVDIRDWTGARVFGYKTQ